ncbi:MAG: inositol oxygenase family protein [Acidobacteriota bacterium]
MKHEKTLENLEQWEEFLLMRYPEEIASGKKAEDFRDYRAEARNCVKEFYRLNHMYQTREFVQSKKREFLSLDRGKKGIWEALEYLNTLVDDSDPDLDLSQLEHLLQTAEAIRRDGHQRWLILVGLIHDLGKVLCLYGEPQWAVVGDTFPVGCAYSPKIVFSEFFELNPDSTVPEYQTPLGLYGEHCGLDNVDMSWGHDEYLYHVVKDYLPEEALYPIRYHSFYAAHREGEYDHLMNQKDRKLFKWVQVFNRYDLYSKSEIAPDVDEIKPFYEDLISEFLPDQLSW